MQSLSERVENIISVLGRSQDMLEEVAYELLNDVDIVKNHNQEMAALTNDIAEAKTDEERTEAIQRLQDHVEKVSVAMDSLSEFVHKNEKASSEQRIYIEEAKQVFDFLWCLLERDKSK